MSESFKQVIEIKDGAGIILDNRDMSFSDSLDDHKQNFKLQKIFSKNTRAQFVPNETFLNIYAGVYNKGHVFNGFVSKNEQEGKMLNIELEGTVHLLEQKPDSFDYKNETIKSVFEKVAKALKLKVVWDSKIKNEKITRSEIMKSDTSDTSGDNVTGTFIVSCSYCRGKVGPNKEATTTFVNKCGRCGKTGKMTDTPKGGRKKVPEGEWTCDTAKGGCGADFCGYCGKEKMDPAKGWLTQVSVPEAVKR